MAKTNAEKLNAFIEKVKVVHGDLVGTSKVKYINSSTKVCLVCHKKDKDGNEHGEYWQSPSECVRGKHCPKCGNEKRSVRTMTTDLFRKKANEAHNGKYDLSEAEYKSANDKVCIICPEHGRFWQFPYAHLNGHGCPKCSNRGLTTDEVIKKFREVHGEKYCYDTVRYSGMKKPVTIKCPEHGEFQQTPQKHLKGQGCPICGNTQKNKDRVMTLDKFIERSNIVHNTKYSYPEQRLNGLHSKLSIICPIHGEFIQNAYDHLNGHGCPKCGVTMSKAEDEIYTFLQSLYVGEVQRNVRNVISPYELDIYVPSAKLGIEYNGIKWHSEEFGKNNQYHLNKLNMCNEHGVTLIQVFEDEYDEHKKIVLEKIRHLLKKDCCKEKVFARKCTVREILRTDAIGFLTTNHIQGFTPSTIYIGAYHCNRLIAVMTFKNVKKGSDEWELSRFATDIDYHCVGLGGKLFSYFIRNYHPLSVKSFADRRWTLSADNNLYTKLGFTIGKILNPDYRYAVGKNRVHKFNFRKKRILATYPNSGLNKDMTEKEMMDKIGVYRIWDCGLIRYEKQFENEKGDNVK